MQGERCSVRLPVIHGVSNLYVNCCTVCGHDLYMGQQSIGLDGTSQYMLSYHGAELIQPQTTEYLPHPANLAQHAKQVLKDPSRA